MSFSNKFTILADFLDTIPDHEPRFDLRTFFDTCSVDLEHKYVKTGDMPSPDCGTTACALGWGPAAGIIPSPDTFKNGTMYWNRYFLTDFMGRKLPEKGFMFIYDDEEADAVFAWCFDERWAPIDNTAKGAAARIRYMLDGKDISNPRINSDIYREYRK